MLFHFQMFITLLLLQSLLKCDRETLFKFKTFSLQGMVTPTNISYFYGIPYAHPLIRQNKEFFHETPSDIYDGQLPRGTFKSRTFDNNHCLGENGDQIEASLCLDFDLFAPSPVAGGAHIQKCPQINSPSFTFVWHVDVLSKDRIKIKNDAISLAKDMNALVVVLYYRSGVLGFSGLVSPNLGFDDIRLAHLLVFQFSRFFCISVDRIVYSGYSEPAMELSFLSMNDIPYSGIYVLFGAYSQPFPNDKDLKIRQLEALYSCSNFDCLLDKIEWVNADNLTNYIETLDKFGPWFPENAGNARFLEQAPSLPVLYGFTACDIYSVIPRFYRGPKLTSEDQVLAAIKTIINNERFGGNDEAIAQKILSFYLEERNYERILGRFLFDLFGLYKIWNSSLDVVKDITFVNFCGTCGDISPLFPFTSSFWLRTELLNIISDFVEYNSRFTDSVYWQFGRNKSEDTLVQTFLPSGTSIWASVGEDRDFQFLKGLYYGNTPKKSVMGVMYIMLIFVAVVVIVVILAVVVRRYRPKPSKVDKGQFEFPGVFMDDTDFIWKNDNEGMLIE